MEPLRFIFTSLVVIFAVTTVTATPVDPFGARWLHALSNRQTGSVDDKLDRASKATSIHEVLRILYPEREPEDVWQELTVEKEVFNPGARLGSSVVMRPATTEDLVEIQNQVDKSKCSKPIDVTVDAYSELGYERRLGTHLWPECVTVPRCDAKCGCCGEGEICTSVRNSHALIPKLFYVFSETGSHVAIKNVTSHTDCECAVDPSHGNTPLVDTSCPPPADGCPSPKVWDEESCTCVCARGCPEPYLQDPHTCECDCLHSNKECGKVKRGQKNLPEESCRCVQNNECGMPTCRYGIFYVAGCHCPA